MFNNISKAAAFNKHKARAHPLLKQAYTVYGYCIRIRETL